MPKRKKQRRTRFSLISLGCPKALVDTEQMAGQLATEGWELVAEGEPADMLLINTCGFLADARDESEAAIRDALALKRDGVVRRVIVAGCLVDHQGGSLAERFPEVDSFLPSAAERDIPHLAAGLAPRFSHGAVPVGLDLPPRLRLTLPHVAYLKIAEGCNRVCSFCTIPAIRGRYRSRPEEAILAEAESLADAGTRELVLIAQDTSFYGIDIDGQPGLADLLRRLDRIEAIRWVRLMYLYPAHITDELIDAIVNSRNVVPYLDLPLQHINDNVLRRMRRGVSRAETLELLDRLRERIPGLALRTTLIVGFPGETEEQFAELLDFVAERRFERLGAFAYRDEPGTAAYELDGKLPDEEIERRLDSLMGQQREVALAWGEGQVGRRIEVIVDAPVDEQPGAYLGRSIADAPDVDGTVYLTAEEGALRPGQFVEAEVVASREYDLIAVVDAGI